MNCRLIIFLFFLTCSQVSAQTTGIGIGAILGEPTGISAKIWMSEHNAVTGALAWSFRDAGSLQIQADYLIHADLTSEIDQDIKGRAYFHYGIGGRLRDDTADNRISARAPLGVTYASRKSSLDAFIEIVPLLDFSPETAFDMNAAVGVRFYFGGGNRASASQTRVVGRRQSLNSN
jgi:hypothetical protein